jgi:hypothetical protein
MLEQTRPNDSAFATLDHHIAHDEHEQLRMEGEPGLTKREYMAAAIMASLYAHYGVESMSDRDMATNAVAAADQLIDRLNTYKPPR